MGAISRLPGDEKGNFLVFFGLSVAVLLGTVALSFDLGRLAATQTELQSFADSVALAAAAELDGGPTSVDRARDAAARLITDRQTFAAGGQVLNSADFSLTFLSALPPNDRAFDPPGNIVCQDVGCNGLSARDANRAILVRVDVDPHSMPFSFASVLSIGGNDVAEEGEVMATATAGFTQFACDIAPLFFCAPPGGVRAGQMVRLRAGGGGAGWGPGNFGFLDISSTAVDPGGPCAGITSPANLTRCLLGASERITSCYSLRGVTTDPGHSVGITTNPINFRFDLFTSSDKSLATDVRFQPAPNTIRGQDPKEKGSSGTYDWCDPVEPPLTTITTDPATRRTSMALPPGAEFLSDTVRFGSATSFAPGSPDRIEYVATNYNGTDPFPTIRTRWAYYNAEIARAASGRILTGTTLSGQTRLETGVAQCASTRSTDPERRVMVAAAVDCTGIDLTGKSPIVEVEQFWRFFLTQPVGDSSDKDIFGEMIDNLGGTGSTSAGVFHDVVQLYR